MSISTDQSTINRLQREIADLRSREATEVRKQADCTKKMNSAAASATRASSVSSLNSYMRDAQRHARELESAHSRHSAISEQIARKTKEISFVQERLGRAEDSERKARQRAETKRQEDHDPKMREMEQRIATLTSGVVPLSKRPLATGEMETHDVFICHASEDKADFADALAEKAKLAGLDVWYDAFKIDWGDSLRQKIDHGLAGSYFGVVIISSNFFAKPWTQYELDGLVQKEVAGEGRILPVWHKVTLDEVRKRSPALAGRLALNTMTISIDGIVARLLEMRDRLKGA